MADEGEHEIPFSLDGDPKCCDLTIGMPVGIH